MPCRTVLCSRSASSRRWGLEQRSMTLRSDGAGQPSPTRCTQVKTPTPLQTRTHISKVALILYTHALENNATLFTAYFSRYKLLPVGFSHGLGQNYTHFRSDLREMQRPSRWSMGVNCISQ
eukprot:COSAG02_NODE_2923_length_7743_cov_6.813448_7_plen_121_part_00